MAVNYFWNVKLSEALYPGLAALEVTLRNSIHEALTAREGSDMWFRTLLEPRQLRDFAATAANLHERRWKKKLPPPTTGQIVAELNFGFWTSVLSRIYHQTIWNQNNAATLRAVFPNLTGHRFQRHLIHTHCNQIRELRNRVMHHEPILNGLRWDNQQRVQIIPINVLHQNILEAIGWISQDTLTTISDLDNFPTIFQQGRADIERDIKQQLGIPWHRSDNRPTGSRSCVLVLLVQGVALPSLTADSPLNRLENDTFPERFHVISLGQLPIFVQVKPAPAYMRDGRQMNVTLAAIGGGGTSDGPLVESREAWGMDARTLCGPHEADHIGDRYQ